MPKFRLKTRSGIIVLNVLLEGKRDSRIIRMLLDTGASISTIPKQLAMAIGSDPSKPKKRIQRISVGGRKSVPVVVVPMVRFLGFEIKNVEMACLSLPHQSTVSGLLGLNILKHFDLFLKFRKKILEIKN